MYAWVLPKSSLFCYALLFVTSILYVSNVGAINKCSH